VTEAYRKKLIEVALPLAEINAASAREKSIRHGHPSTLHLWWARRPLAACRAVLFGQLVDDPSAVPEEFPTEADQVRERDRLFEIIKQLVLWENSNNQTVLDAAKQEIARSVARDKGVPAPTSPQAVQQFLIEHAPPVLDPFCGGGSIPLEAQRLGLRAYGSDLNPVAVLITKALIEIPPKFAGQPPVNPEDRTKMGSSVAWPGATGLAADVRYYGRWMRDEAQRRIGHLYPKVQLPGGQGEATVIAWLWARTVRCPNPACGTQMPLVRSFALSTKPGKAAWVEPQVDPAAKTVRFQVRTGSGKVPEGTVNRRGARCLVCNTPVALEWIRAEGRAARISQQLMAVVAEGARGRIYLAPTPEQVAVADEAKPEWAPETTLPKQALGFRVQLYGMTRHRDLFTPRQLVALTTFSDLVGEVRTRVLADAMGVHAYADAVATYLALGTSRLTDICNSLCMWENTKTQVRHLFTRQAIPMLWDFAEANVFAEGAGDYSISLGNLLKALEMTPASTPGHVQQVDATTMTSSVSFPLISTDPPYYDNIGYADLSDFFYTWLRRSLRDVYPDLFGTLLTPKDRELIAAPYRFDSSKERAEQFFEEGLRAAFSRLHAAQAPGYPLTVYYAFKQAEEDTHEGGTEADVAIASTGWATMLEGLLQAGFAINGTWPMRSELSNRPRSMDSNALASSIVLVCRPRPADAPIATRREFISALKQELPKALRTLQQGNIAPVDLQQAAIGPGMAVFSRYRQVVDPSGKPLPVRAALGLINQALDEVLSEQEGDFDGDTRWAITWFEQYGLGEGEYGSAETLSKAKDTSVAALQAAGILQSRAGKVRLLRREELPTTGQQHQRSAWAVTQHLIKALQEGGEGQAAARLASIGPAAETARELAYRLYLTCERKGGLQEEAGAYNGLVVAWPEIARLAEQQATAPRQETLV
jgi:putative DNA methylase